MASVLSGSTTSVRCPLNGTVTVTPGTSGAAAVSVQSLDSPTFQAQTITAVKTFDVVAGDRLSITAIGADATHTTPAGSDAVLQSLSSNDGSLVHQRYFTHLFAGNQLADDDKVYDISGAQGHATRETDLSVSALWTTRAGYASTLDSSAVDGSRLTRLALPALNWDWVGGESLFIWWLGKCTKEGASTNLMGNCRGAAGENGFRVRVASTGAVGFTMSEGATATTTFTVSTLLPFDTGALSSVGFWLDGVRRLGYSYVNETQQVGGNTPTGDMLPTSAQVSAGTDKLILGGDSLLTGGATSAIAQSTRALVILKFAATDTTPTAEQVRQAMLQLRADPSRVLAVGSL